MIIKRVPVIFLLIFLLVSISSIQCKAEVDISLSDQKIIEMGLNDFITYYTDASNDKGLTGEDEAHDFFFKVQRRVNDRFLHNSTDKIKNRLKSIRDTLAQWDKNVVVFVETESNGGIYFRHYNYREGGSFPEPYISQFIDILKRDDIKPDYIQRIESDNFLSFINSIIVTKMKPPPELNKERLSEYKKVYTDMKNTIIKLNDLVKVLPDPLAHKVSLYAAHSLLLIMCDFNNHTIVVDEYNMLSLRVVVNWLGGKLIISENNELVVYYKGKKVAFQKNSAFVNVDGTEIQMPVAVQEVDSITYIPIQVLINEFGIKTISDPDDNGIFLICPSSGDKLKFYYKKVNIKNEKTASIFSNIKISKAEEQLRSEFDIADNYYNAQKVKLDQYPLWNIYGDINRRDGNSIIVWGIARSRNAPKNHPGWLLNNGNIIVHNADPKCIAFNKYNGTNYYRGETSGNNAFGASVPCKIFGDFPEDEVLLPTNVNIGLIKANDAANSLINHVEGIYDKQYNDSYNDASFHVNYAAHCLLLSDILIQRNYQVEKLKENIMKEFRMAVTIYIQKGMLVSAVNLLKQISEKGVFVKGSKFYNNNNENILEEIASDYYDRLSYICSDFTDVHLKVIIKSTIDVISILPDNSNIKGKLKSWSRLWTIISSNYPITKSSQLGIEYIIAPTGYILSGINEEDYFGIAIVTKVVIKGPAAESEVKRGDIIIKYRNEVFDNSDDLISLIQKTKPNSEITLNIVRNDKARDVTIITR